MSISTARASTSASNYYTQVFTQIGTAGEHCTQIRWDKIYNWGRKAAQNRCSHGRVLGGGGYEDFRDRAMQWEILEEKFMFSTKKERNDSDSKHPA